jgi:hypothetical protein
VQIPVITEDAILPVPINPKIIWILYQRVKKKPP